jgi:hypothetical protein
VVAEGVKETKKKVLAELDHMERRGDVAHTDRGWKLSTRKVGT